MADDTPVQNAAPATDAPATDAPVVKPEEEMTEDELKVLHEAEDFISNFDPADLADPEKAAELEEKLKSAKTTVAQKRHYRDQVTKLKGTPAPTAPTGPTAPAAPAPEKKTEEVKGIDPNVATEFRLDHPELSKEQAKKILQHAAAYQITPEEALKDPLMVQYVQSTTNNEDAEDASPAPANQPGGSIAERDWSNATPKEMEAARNKMLYPNG